MRAMNLCALGQTLFIQAKARAAQTAMVRPQQTCLRAHKIGMKMHIRIRKIPFCPQWETTQFHQGHTMRRLIAHGSRMATTIYATAIMGTMNGGARLVTMTMTDAMMLQKGKGVVAK